MKLSSIVLLFALLGIVLAQPPRGYINTGSMFRLRSSYVPSRRDYRLHPFRPRVGGLSFRRAKQIIMTRG
uniref:Uncharacterized protein n=1 Tax=Steinernema glaseri TaxID=37863 RepID=A0A1I7YXD4_9BILA